MTADSSATFTPLARIETSGGEVLKALTAEEDSFRGLGEAYFSRVSPGAIRAWKLHTEMTVNVVVPVGHVRFVVAVPAGGESARNEPEGKGDAANLEHEAGRYTFAEYDLGIAEGAEYGRLTIEPGTWFGFKGGAEGGLVLNLSNILHRPDEGRGRELDEFTYQW